MCPTSSVFLTLHHFPHQPGGSRSEVTQKRSVDLPISQTRCFSDMLLLVAIYLTALAHDIPLLVMLFPLNISANVPLIPYLNIVLIFIKYACTQFKRQLLLSGMSRPIAVPSLLFLIPFRIYILHIVDFPVWKVTIGFSLLPLCHILGCQYGKLQLGLVNLVFMLLLHHSELTYGQL